MHKDDAQRRRDEPSPAANLHVVALADVVDMHRNACIRANAVLFHQRNQIALCQIRGRRRLLLSQRQLCNLQHLALANRWQGLVVRRFEPVHDTRKARVQHLHAHSRKPFRANLRLHQRLQQLGIFADSGNEMADNKVVQPPVVAAELARVCKPRRRDGWVVPNVLASLWGREVAGEKIADLWELRWLSLEWAKMCEASWVWGEGGEWKSRREGGTFFFFWNKKLKTYTTTPLWRRLQHLQYASQVKVRWIGRGFRARVANVALGWCGETKRAKCACACMWMCVYEQWKEK